MAGNKAFIKYYDGLFFPAFVGVAFSESDYLKEMKRLGVDQAPDFHCSAASVKAFNRKGKNCYIICFDPVKHKKLHINQKVALIAHECVHVSDLIFQQIGEDKPGDETRAYLVQYLLQETLYRMGDFLKCRKK